MTKTIAPLAPRVLITLLLLIGLGAAPAAAQEASSRELGGHLLLPSELVANPLITTHFSSSTGFGYASLAVRNAQGGGEDQYLLGALSQGFELQLGLLPFWAVRVYAAGNVFSGLNQEAALNAGLQLGYQVGGGTTFSFPLRGRARLGFAVDVDYSPSWAFNILDAVNQSIAADRIDSSTLLRQTSPVTVGAAFQAAVAVHRSLGLYTDLRYRHSFIQSDAGRSNEGEFTLGAALSFDLHALSPVPLGALFAYKLTVPATGDPELAHDLSAGLLYTGRRHLALGPQASFRLYAASPTTRIFTVEGVLLMRYFW